VTKSCNKIETELAKEEPDHEELQVLLNRLRDTKKKVAELDDRVRTQMLDDTVTEEDALSETDVIEDYATKIERAIVRVEKIIAPPARPPSPAPSSYSTAHNNPASKAYRLPKIEMPKFTGELKDWLGWWSQFSRIDQDDQLHTSDKFQYLKQAVTKGTEAADIIAEFPLTEDNYPKALQALKDRYGREDLLVQVYVRELLGLVINNNSNKNQIPLAKLHIQLKTHLRALESLNLAKADPETWLFPLVESSLPEESLRVWQRSSLSEQDGSKVDPPRSKLSYLLEFMEKEVKNEQQISLAKIGFSVQEPDKKKGRNFTKSIKNEEEISTAASLYAGTPEECIFCKKTNHQSGDCFKARRLSLDERRLRNQEPVTIV
jgi:nucleoid DNA-binding protein